MPTTSTNRPKRTNTYSPAYNRRTYKRRTISRRRKGCLYLIAVPSTLVMLLIIAGIIVIWLASSHSKDSKPVTHLRSYVLPVKPSVSADFINQVLDYYHSPAAGKGQALYNDGVKYGIDPVYALAFFMQESTFGTQGVATVTHSLGNIRANTGDPQYHGYRMYSTWEAGFEDWYKLMAHQYIGQWKLTTVDQIVPIYAPGSDNNDVTTYIQNVKNAVDIWHSGSVGV
ncbi:MAG TPA: glucosaminidase domain-containing protein [Ktedonobacteraceae bacterium]|nr:glucosaminidase domain-containing protein [Ktedonobacteraceae bacterium]